MWLSSWGDAVVLTVTFILVIFRDLTEGIVVGFALGALLFIHRMASAAALVAHLPMIPEDVPDTSGGKRAPYVPTSDPDLLVYRLNGAFFFGSASAIGAVLDRIADQRKTLVLDISAVPFLDFDSSQSD